jgi:hypothetical protein
MGNYEDWQDQKGFLVERSSRSKWSTFSEVDKSHAPQETWGLGILDLELFHRALHLRWLWLEWNDQYWPWVSTAIPYDAMDRQLFRTSTIVTIGDRHKASF